MLEGVSVSSESLQVAVSAYSRTVLTKKNLQKMSLPYTLCSTAAGAPNYWLKSELIFPYGLLQGFKTSYFAIVYVTFQWSY
jgi:hypothetical protein